MILNTGKAKYKKLVKVTDDGRNLPLDKDNKLVSETGSIQDSKLNLESDSDYIEPFESSDCPANKEPIYRDTGASKCADSSFIPASNSLQLKYYGGSVNHNAPGWFNSFDLNNILVNGQRVPLAKPLEITKIEPNANWFKFVGKENIKLPEYRTLITDEPLNKQESVYWFTWDGQNVPYSSQEISAKVYIKNNHLTEEYDYYPLPEYIETTLVTKEVDEQISSGYGIPVLNYSIKMSDLSRDNFDNALVQLTGYDWKLRESQRVLEEDNSILNKLDSVLLIAKYDSVNKTIGNGSYFKSDSTTSITNANFVGRYEGLTLSNFDSYIFKIVAVGKNGEFKYYDDVSNVRNNPLIIPTTHNRDLTQILEIVVFNGIYQVFNITINKEGSDDIII